MKKLVLMCMVLGLMVAPALALPTADLTTVGSSGTVNGSVGGTAVFVEWVITPATGSGVYDPYVRIGTTGNSTSERGYNTGLEGSHVGGEEFDTKDNGGTKFDHALLLSTIPVVQDPAGVSGTFREFTLDLNQDNGFGQFLSLDALKVYQSSQSNLTGWPGSFPAPIWDMGNNWVAMNGSNLLDNGSGKGDILVYIPDSLFDTNLDYVYWYTQMGLQTDTSLAINPDGLWQATDGFEEWGVQTGTEPPPPTVVPAPGAILLGGIGVSIVGWLRTRRQL